MDKHEALTVIRKNYPHVASSGSYFETALRELIPELKESEDEKIRKVIIEHFKSKTKETWCGLPIANIITYLEKQKAKERLDRMAPIYNDKESFESALEKAWKYYNESASRTVDSFEDDYIECVFSKGFREGFLYREKQKEQIPYIDFVIKPHKGDDTNPYDMSVSEAQEYAIKRGFGIPFNDGEVYVDERHITQTIGNIIRWADEHPKEQNLSESCDNICCEDDRFKIIGEAKKDIIEKTNIAENELSMELPLLDGILMRVWQVGWLNKKQKPAEWSEEDKEMVRRAIFYTEQYRTNYGDTKESEECFNWLLDLHRNIRPPFHWKPSEEQMEVFVDSIYFLEQNGFKDPNGMIESLYQDLKKL